MDGLKFLKICEDIKFAGTFRIKTMRDKKSKKLKSLLKFKAK